MPECKDWTDIALADTMRTMIARASSRMMGGLALSRNREWLETSVSFTTNAWMAAQRLKSWPSWTRGIVQRFISEMTALRTNMKVARRAVSPLVHSRISAREDEKEKPVDLLQMLMDGAEGNDNTPQFLAYTMLAVAFAAVHTSSSVPTHIIYDLCAYPEYIQPLREEAQATLDKHGSWTRAALNDLVKLDSFMKESQRFNPLVFSKPIPPLHTIPHLLTPATPHIVTFGRVIHKDLRLSDGLLIPAQTVIGIPSHAINHAEDFYPRPESFEPWRFLRDGASAPTSFVTTSSSSMSWGYGKHACSGRFFACDEIKIVVAHLLLDYEFKFGDGARGRPRNVSYELQNAPDPGVSVFMKRRR